MDFIKRAALFKSPRRFYGAKTHQVDNTYNVAVLKHSEKTSPKNMTLYLIMSDKMLKKFANLHFFLREIRRVFGCSTTSL